MSPLNLASLYGKCVEPLVLPLASIEFHGSWLPLGTDYAIAECVVSRLDRVVAAPVLAYTSSVEHRGYPYASADPVTFTAYLTSLLESLATLTNCVVVAVFHGGAYAPAVAAVRAARARVESLRASVFDFWSTVARILGLEAVTHAGPVESSIASACSVEVRGRVVTESEAIEAERRRTEKCRLLPGWMARDCPAMYAGDGVVYSPALGEKIVEESVEKLREAVESTCRGNR